MAPAGLPPRVHCQGMTQNQGEMAKQSQMQHLVHQGGGTQLRVSKGIATSGQHDGDLYQDNLDFECQSQSPLGNVQSLKQTGGEIQLTQLHNKEAGMVKDYQQSLQPETVHGPVDSILPVYNESVPSALGVGIAKDY